MENTYRLTGIDPGTTNVGFACFIIDASTLKLLKIETVNINVSNRDKTPSSTIPYNGKVTLRLNALSYELTLLFKKYKPIACSCEEVYINKFRPAAVSPLAKATRTIEYTYHCVIGGYMKSVNAMTAKKMFNVKRPKRKKGDPKIDQKLLMLEALDRTALTDFILEDINDLTEHEIDAIAICLVLYNEFLVSSKLRFQLLTDEDLQKATSRYLHIPKHIEK